MTSFRVIKTKLYHIIVILSTFLLISCGTQFTYNNLDFFVDWYLDDYVELNKQQRATFDSVFEEVWHWHRKVELEAYNSQLTQLKRDVEANQLTQETLNNHFSTAQQHWSRTRNHLAQMFLPLLSELTTEQVEQLFAKIGENNDKAPEVQTEEERHKARIKDLQEDVKGWIGKLSYRQKQIVVQYEPAFKSSSALFREYRKTSQAEIKSLMLTGEKGRPQYLKKLQQMLTKPEQFKPEALVEAQLHNRKVYSEMLAEIAKTLSKKQKRKLISEIDELLDDVNALQAKA